MACMPSLVKILVLEENVVKMVFGAGRVFPEAFEGDLFVILAGQFGDSI